MAAAVNMKISGIATMMQATMRKSQISVVAIFSKYQFLVFCAFNLITPCSMETTHIWLTSSVRETFSCSHVNANITMKSKILMAVARPIR